MKLNGKNLRSVTKPGKAMLVYKKLSIYNYKIPFSIEEQKFSVNTYGKDVNI